MINPPDDQSQKYQKLVALFDSYPFLRSKLTPGHLQTDRFPVGIKELLHEFSDEEWNKALSESLQGSEKSRKDRRGKIQGFVTTFAQNKSWGRLIEYTKNVDWDYQYNGERRTEPVKLSFLGSAIEACFYAKNYNGNSDRYTKQAHKNKEYKLSITGQIKAIDKILKFLNSNTKTPANNYVGLKFIEGLLSAKIEYDTKKHFGDNYGVLIDILINYKESLKKGHDYYSRYSEGCLSYPKKPTNTPSGPKLLMLNLAIYLHGWKTRNDYWYRISHGYEVEVPEKMIFTDADCDVIAGIVNDVMYIDGENTETVKSVRDALKGKHGRGIKLIPWPDDAFN